MNVSPCLQWHYAGNRGGDYFANITKVEHKYEAQASWSTPQGSGRYRIWSRPGDVYGGNHFYEVVRLKPSIGAWKFNGRLLKFSGRALGRAHTMAEAEAIAEADNARLCGAAEGGN